MKQRFRLACLVVLVGSGCARHGILPPEDREALRNDLILKDGTPFLRLSYYVTGFYGDPTRRLLTPLPPAEVPFVYGTNGDPSPGQVERILPTGTRMRILRVEFPTTWVVALRVPGTPRNLVWIYLTPEEQPTLVPLVLVIPSTVQSKEEFQAVLAQYLTLNDPALRLRRCPDHVRQAIRTKTAVIDMPADAVEMALGYPESKHVTFEEISKKEEWVYPGHLRVAFLAADRLVRVETRAR